MGSRSAVLGVADACGHPHWGLLWSSLWGHGALYWVWGTHAGTRCAGRGGRMRAAPLGSSVELPVGPRSAVLGVADAGGHPDWGLRWSSLCGHVMLFWVWGTHAGTPTGPFA
eukprot:6521687-Pyramimonas_sp.AAC.1